MRGVGLDHRFVLNCHSMFSAHELYTEQEQQQQLAQQDDADKSSAWKAYMAQVKAYEARSCTDEDGHRRPLVK